MTFVETSVCNSPFAIKKSYPLIQENNLFGKNTKKLYGKAAEKTTKQKKKKKKKQKNRFRPACLISQP